MKKVGNAVKSFWKGLKKGVKILIIALLIITIAVIVGVIIYNATIPYDVLFTDLSAEDMTSVLTYLEEAGETDYKVQGDDTILVRENRVDYLQAKVMQQGYPTSGLLYSTYWDNVGSMSSESERTQAELYQLQDRLGAMIGLMDDIDRATVNIVLGEDNRYILSTEDKVTATAAVFVELADNKTILSSTVANGIINCVAHSVAGLEFENISLTDNHGNTYDGEETETESAIEATDLRIAYEKSYSEAIKSRVIAVLGPMFGENNISVSVSVSVDLSHKYQESTYYDIPDWADDGSTGGEGIVNHMIWENALTRDADETVGGTVGTTTNSDLNEYVENEGTITGNENDISTYGEKYFDNDVVYTQSDIPAGDITDIMVAVALDSTNVTVTDTSPLIGLVARAAGINELYEDEKVNIIAYPFYTQINNATPTEPDNIDTGNLLDLPAWVLIAVAGGLLLLIIILIIVLILTRKKRKKQKQQQEDEEKERVLEEQRHQEEIAALAAMQAQEEEEPTEGANIMEINTEPSIELRRDVRQFAEENPEIAAQMVKNWLRGGDDSSNG